MSSLRRVGSDAEDLAAEYLLGIGYTVVTRRFKSSRGEIDIVALDGQTLVFVEVKSRRTDDAPEAEVDARKVSDLSRAADEYLHKSGLTETPVRYDLIAVTPAGLRHHIDAFRAV